MRIQNIYWEKISIDENGTKLSRTNCMIRIDEHTVSIQDRDRDGHLIYMDPRLILLTPNKLVVEAQKMMFVSGGTPTKVPVKIEVEL